MARAYACLLLAAVLPAPLHAQQFSVPNTLALEDWGVFAASVTKRVPAPDTSSGVREIPSQVTLIQKTHDICASLGMQFGFRYHLTGTVPVLTMQLTIRVEHPAFATWNGRRSAFDTYPTAIYAGQSHWTGWAFRDPTKLVDGEWRFSVRHQGHLLLDQQFRVRIGCTIPIS